MIRGNLQDQLVGTRVEVQIASSGDGRRRDVIGTTATNSGISREDQRHPESAADLQCAALDRQRGGIRNIRINILQTTGGEGDAGAGRRARENEGVQCIRVAPVHQHHLTGPSECPGEGEIAARAAQREPCPTQLHGACAGETADGGVGSREVEDRACAGKLHGQISQGRGRECPPAPAADG